MERLDSYGAVIPLRAAGALAHQHVHRGVAAAAHLHLAPGRREYIFYYIHKGYGISFSYRLSFLQVNKDRNITKIDEVHNFIRRLHFYG